MGENEDRLAKLEADVQHLTETVQTLTKVILTGDNSMLAQIAAMRVNLASINKLLWVIATALVSTVVKAFVLK